MRSIIGVVIATATAFAEPSPEAQALFEQGRALAKDGNYSEACDRFERANKIEYAVGTSLNLGDCYEHLGEVRRAYLIFVDTEGRAGPRASYAHDRAQALLAKLGTIVVHVANPIMPGLKISIAGRDVAPVPEIDDVNEPGVVTIIATAPDRPEYRTTATAVAGQRTIVDVPLFGATPTEHVVEPAGQWQRRPERVHVAVALGSLGIGAMIGGIVVGLYARSEYNAQFPGHCMSTTTGPACDTPGFTNLTNANNLADAGTVIGVAGIALVAAGALIYWTAPHDHIIVTPTPGGVAVAGRF